MQVIETTLELTKIMHFKAALSASECADIVQQVKTAKLKGMPNIQGGSPNTWRALNENILLIESANILANSIYNCVDIYFESLETKIDLNKYNINSWFNINSKDGYNLFHTHAGSLLSGVVYFQGTGTGPIQFNTLNNIYKLTHPDWPFSSGHSIDPEEGDIILFPSYLGHSVNHNTSDKSRVNLAFNVMDKI